MLRREQAPDELRVGDIATKEIVKCDHGVSLKAASS